MRLQTPRIVKTRNIILNAELDTLLDITSSNVYQGIEVNDTSEMQRKSQIVKDITKLINARQLSHEDAAKLLQIDLSHLVRIKRGQFREIEEEVLLQMASKLSA
jgi:predicted XRE-type DNA-binding protein